MSNCNNNPRNNIRRKTTAFHLADVTPGDIDSRQQRRRRLVIDCMEKLIKRYRRGFNTHQWPMEMPRRVRRLIARNMAKHLTREHGLKAIT